MTRRPDARARPSAARLADDPLWYKDAIIYEVHVRAFHDSDGDGIGDFRGLTAEARLPRRTSASPRSGCCRSTRRRCGRRLRHRRLHRRPSRLRHAATTSSAFLARGAPARPARHHRAGHQPHLRPAPLVPARPPRAAAAAPSATSTSGATRPTSTATRASSSRTSSRRTGPGTRSPRRTTGTASTRTSPT